VGYRRDNEKSLHPNHLPLARFSLLWNARSRKICKNMIRDQGSEVRILSPRFSILITGPFRNTPERAVDGFCRNSFLSDHLHSYLTKFASPVWSTVTRSPSDRICRKFRMSVKRITSMRTKLAIRPAAKAHYDLLIQELGGVDCCGLKRRNGAVLH